MFTQSFAAGEPPRSAAVAPAPQVPGRLARLSGWIGLALSLVLAVAASREFRAFDWASLSGVMRQGWAFWAVFAAWYLCGPVGDWVIFRRLWNIPASGFVPLLRKLVSNELVFGYLGEAQFYAWARSRKGIDKAPFGAIKDVALLSAVVGNLFTLVLFAATWRVITGAAIGIELRAAFASVGVAMLVSIAMFAFREKLFCLPRRELAFTAAVHALRTAAALILVACLWHLAMPAVATATWVLLAALRMLVSRLPLVPNKEIVFAGLSAFVVGADSQVASLTGFIAGISLLTHIAVGLLLAAEDFVTARSQA